MAIHHGRHHKYTQWLGSEHTGWWRGGKQGRSSEGTVATTEDDTLDQCGFHTLNHAYILTTLAITHSLLPSNPPYLVAPWLQHVEPLLALREPTLLSCEEAVSQEEITKLSNSGVQRFSCQESYYSDVCGEISAKYPKSMSIWVQTCSEIVYLLENIFVDQRSPQTTSDFSSLASTSPSIASPID